jgi:hypothetical protein
MMRFLATPSVAILLAGCSWMPGHSASPQKQSVSYQVPPECQAQCELAKNDCDHDCYGPHGANLGCLPSCSARYDKCLNACQVPTATPGA